MHKAPSSVFLSFPSQQGEQEVLRTAPSGRTSPVVPQETTKVFLALLSLRRPTVRAVAEASGKSVSVTHRHLCRLRNEGLVAWEDGCDGTLRALYGPVAA